MRDRSDPTEMRIPVEMDTQFGDRDEQIGAHTSRKSFLTVDNPARPIDCE